MFIVERNILEGMELSANNRISRSLIRGNQSLFFELMEFMAKIICKIDNIIVYPEDVYIEDGEMYLLDFKYASDHVSSKTILTAIIEWAYRDTDKEVTF